MKKLAVLISNAGTGTNLQAIIDAIEQKKIDATISVVISDTENAKGLERAKKHKLPIAICKKKEDLLKIIYPSSDPEPVEGESRSDKKDSSRQDGYQTVTRRARTIPYLVDYICLAGWKQFILDEIIDLYKNKILNLHPGLIPDNINGIVKNPDRTKALWNKGKLTDLAIANFLDNNATYAGSSIHFLSHEFDFGKVLGRTFEKIKKGDTVESLYKRLKIKENALYIKVLQKLCK